MSTRQPMNKTQSEANPSVPLRQLGERLRRERGERGIRDAAREIGVSPATLSRVERGYLPDLQTFGKICRWLRIDPAELLGIDVEKPKAASPTQPAFAAATAHFRADQTTSASLADALAQMLLAGQEMLKLPEVKSSN